MSLIHGVEKVVYFDSTSLLSPECTFSLLMSLIHGVEKVVVSLSDSRWTPRRLLHTDPSLEAVGFFPSTRCADLAMRCQRREQHAITTPDPVTVAIRATGR